MTPYEQITQAVYDAIGEVNQTLEPGLKLEKSPDTVVLGESAQLDSIGVVTLLTTVEENVQRTFNRAISLIDAVPATPTESWTVASMTWSIAKMLGRVAHD